MATSLGITEGVNGVCCSAVSGSLDCINVVAFGMGLRASHPGI